MVIAGDSRDLEDLLELMGLRGVFDRDPSSFQVERQTE